MTKWAQKIWIYSVLICTGLATSILVASSVQPIKTLIPDKFASLRFVLAYCYIVSSVFFFLGLGYILYLLTNWLISRDKNS